MPRITQPSPTVSLRSKHLWPRRRAMKCKAWPFAGKSWGKGEEGAFLSVSAGQGSSSHHCAVLLPQPGFLLALPFQGPTLSLLLSLSPSLSLYPPLTCQHRLCTSSLNRSWEPNALVPMWKPEEFDALGDVRALRGCLDEKTVGGWSSRCCESGLGKQIYQEWVQVSLTP